MYTHTPILFNQQVLRCSDSSSPKSYACGAHEIVSFKFSLLSSIKVLVHTMGNTVHLYHNTSHLCSPSLPRMNSTQTRNPLLTGSYLISLVSCLPRGRSLAVAPSSRRSCPCCRRRRRHPLFAARRLPPVTRLSPVVEMSDKNNMMKLNNENYEIWKILMEAILVRKQLRDVALGTTP